MATSTPTPDINWESTVESLRRENRSVQKLADHLHGLSKFEVDSIVLRTAFPPSMNQRSAPVLDEEAPSKRIKTQISSNASPTVPEASSPSTFYLQKTPQAPQERPSSMLHCVYCHASFDPGCQGGCQIRHWGDDDFYFENLNHIDEDSEDYSYDPDPIIPCCGQKMADYYSEDGHELRPENHYFCHDGNHHAHYINRTNISIDEQLLEEKLVNEVWYDFQGRRAYFEPWWVLLRVNKEKSKWKSCKELECNV